MLLIPFPKQWSEYDINTLKSLIVLLKDWGFTYTHINHFLMNENTLTNESFKAMFIDVVGVEKSIPYIFDIIINTMTSVVYLINKVRDGSTSNTDYGISSILHNGILFTNDKSRLYTPPRRIDNKRYTNGSR